MDVLTLQGVLTLDKSQYDSGLATAQQGAHSFGGRFSKAMKVGAVAAAALGAATAVAGKKIVSSARQVAEYGDKVDKMSQKIGISAESYQKWDYVMQRAGGNVDQLKMGMKTLSQQAEKNSEAFQQLGISQEEVASASKEELFEKTVKGLSEMEDSTERTALASKLLGRAGADMAPLFNQGSDAIEEQMDIAEKYGMVMPDATVKASAAFQDSMTTLQMTTQGLKNRLLGELLPSMTQVTDGLAKMFIGDTSGLDDIIKGVKGFISKIGGMIPKVLEAGGKVVLELVKGFLQKIPDIVASGGELLGKLLDGMTNMIGNIAPVVTQIVEATAQFVTENAPRLLSAAISLMAALARGLINALPTLVASVPTLVKAIANTIINYNWVGLGRSLIKGIAKGLKSVGGLIKSAVSKPISAAKTAIVDGFNAAKAKAVSYMDALKKGVSDKIKAAKDKVKEVVDKIKSFFPVSVGKVFKGWIPKIKLFTKKKDDKAETSSSVSKTKFAKAMNQPYMFKHPTEFYAGEAGDEFLYGRRSLMDDITEAMNNGGGKTVNITNHITISGAENPEEYMQRFVRSMEMQMRTA